MQYITTRLRWRIGSSAPLPIPWTPPVSAVSGDSRAVTKALLPGVWRGSGVIVTPVHLAVSAASPSRHQTGRFIGIYEQQSTSDSGLKVTKLPKSLFINTTYTCHQRTCSRIPDCNSVPNPGGSRPSIPVHHGPEIFDKTVPVYGNHCSPSAPSSPIFSLGFPDFDGGSLDHESDSDQVPLDALSEERVELDRHFPRTVPGKWYSSRRGTMRLPSSSFPSQCSYLPSQTFMPAWSNTTSKSPVSHNVGGVDA